MAIQQYYIKYAYDLSTAVADEAQPDVQYRSAHHRNNTESDANFYIVAEQAGKDEKLFTSAGERVPTGDFLIYNRDGSTVIGKKRFILDTYDVFDALPELSTQPITD